MDTTSKVCDRSEQLCLKLQSIVSLYKDLKQSNSEEENLLLLGTLRDVKSFLSDKEQGKRSAEDEDKNLEDILEGLHSHAGIVALRSLVRDVREIKNNVEFLRKRVEKVESRKLPSSPYMTKKDSETYDGDPLDPRFWERLTQRRHELLSEVETTLEKRKKALKFHPRIDVTRTTERKQPMASSEQTTNPALSSKTIDKRLTNRITKFEDFLAEKQTRLSTARKSVVGTMMVPQKAECELPNTESAINRSKIAQTMTIGSNDVDEQLRSPPSRNKKSGDLSICSSCQADQKVKDKFWGPVSKSADEEIYETKILSPSDFSPEITELNENEISELFYKLEIKEKQEDGRGKKSQVKFKDSSPVQIQDADFPSGYVIKQSRPRGQAVHGTWASSPYSPNCIVTKRKVSWEEPKTIRDLSTGKEIETRKRSRSRMRRWIERMYEDKHYH